MSSTPANLSRRSASGRAGTMNHRLQAGWSIPWLERDGPFGQIHDLEIKQEREMSKHENNAFEGHEGGCCGHDRGDMGEAGAQRPEPQIANAPHVGQDDDCCGGHGAAEPASQVRRRSGGCGCH